MGVSPLQAPDVPTYVTLDFEKGVPVALDGESMMPQGDHAGKLNEIGGENGIGLVDMVENRLVGMKSRGVYETPGGTILYQCPPGAGNHLLWTRTPPTINSRWPSSLPNWFTTASGIRPCARH